MVDVSIIIINYNTCDLVIQCLQSVYAKTVGVSFEVIVVDNASIDNSSVSIKKYFPQVILIESETNLGFGGANNLAAQHASGNYLFLLNSDTILINNAVKILFDYISTTSTIGICGGNLYDVDMNLVHSYSMFFPSVFGELNAFLGGLLAKIRYANKALYNDSNDPISVSYITGADMMISRVLFEKAAGFSPEFFMYYEETELSFRIKNMKYEIMNNPNAKIIHLEGQSGKTKEQFWKMYLLSRSIFWKKCYSPVYKGLGDFIFRMTCLSRLVLFFFSKSKTQYWRTILHTFNSI